MSAQLQKKYMEHADKQMESGDHYGALRNYQLGMWVDSGDVDVCFAYANALRMTNNYAKALHYYKKVQKSDRDRKYVVAAHFAGEMYKFLGDYNKSQKEHQRFIKKYKGDREKYEYIKSLYEVEHSSDLIHLMRDSSELLPDNQHPINTVFSEFGAYFVNDTLLLYSTLRSDSTKKKLVLDSNTYFARIHMGRIKEKWEAVGSHPAFDKAEEVHIVNATFSPKGEYVFYAECSGFNCQIYRATVTGEVWTDFTLLPDKINLKGTSTTQPFMARIKGLDVLYFVSDRPGGYGKQDIWYSIAYSNGLFEDPVNLGENINSPGNDICPFYLDEEEALYFSSDYYLGMGGFDIFRSMLKEEEYQQNQNMGPPINSSYNDLYFRYHAGEAVISSNRKGSLTDQFENCCNDLYFFDFEPKSITPLEELTTIERINKLLPLRLYFHNDEPNPRSNDTTTDILYSASYIEYISKKELYEKEYTKGLSGDEALEAENEMSLFFRNEVKLGYDDLSQALKLLEKELNEGSTIELSIKGYASPLSKSEYNRNLTFRRINSVENQIEHFNYGSLKSFMDSGKLILKRFPFGEDRLTQRVSDDVNDKRNAIYSKKASFERRVEILSIKKIK